MPNSTNSNIVLNLPSPAQQGTYPWINWVKGGINYGGNPSNVNSVGCPVVAPPHGEIAANAWRMSIQVPVSANYNGHWVLKWTGTGAFSINTNDGGITVDSGAGFVVSNVGTTMLVAGTNPRVEFHTPTGTAGSWFGQMTDTQTYSGMGAPRLMRLADETAEANGQIFLPEFIASIQQLNPQVLRFMQWSSISNFTQTCSKPFTYDPGVNYITYASTSQPTAPFVGNITNTADAFTCSLASDTPGTITDGEMIWGNVLASNTTTSPTLNIGGRGAKKILAHTGGSVVIGQIATSYQIFTYNAMLNGYICNEGAASFLSWDQQVPLAARVSLCNQTGCDAWICLPALITDSEVTSIATYVRQNLNSNLKCYFEFGNEIWGGVPHPADQIQSMATANSTGPAQMLGYMIRRCMGLITTAWAPRSLSTLRRVAAWQEFGSVSGFNTNCLQGQGFALMTSLGWDTAPNRPVDFTDIISYATYYEGPSCPAFQGGYTGNTSGVQAALYTAADQYATGIPVNINTAFAFMDNDIRQGTGGNGDVSTLIGLFNQNAVWEAMLATYDVSRPNNKLQLACYEGGLQINPPTTGTLSGLGVPTAYSAKIANLFNGYKNSSLCKQLVLDQYSQFMFYTHSARPAWYQYGADLTGGTSQWNLWPTGDTYATPFQTFNAIVTWDTSVPPLVTGGGLADGSIDPWRPPTGYYKGSAEQKMREAFAAVAKLFKGY